MLKGPSCHLFPTSDSHPCGSLSGPPAYVSYPLNVNRKGKKIKINSKEDFIKSYNTIITEDVKKALLNQDVTKTFVNYQGVMVGDGEMWFTHIKNKAMIDVINIFEINEKHGISK